ncbi:MAG: polysaccharide deacetylase family protein, partial [Nocardioidaceae bacterium]
VFLVAGTLSVPGHQVDWVDTPPDYPLRTLQLEQIREMQSAGIGFESHSLHHADLTSLSFADCVEDLRSSRELLETLLGHDVRMLAYPRGRHSADVRRAAQRAGYSHAFTLPESREPVGRYAIPRVGLYRGNNAPNLRIKLSRPYLSVRTSRVFEIRRRAGRVGAAAR